MIYILENACQSKALENLLRIAKKALGLIQVVGPILAIVSLTIIFIRLLNNPEDKKLLKNLKNSVIALVILFFVPLIVNVAMNLADDSFSLSSCWNSISDEVNPSTYIEDSNNNKQNIIGNPDKYEKGEKKKPSSNGNNTTGTQSSENGNASISKLDIGKGNNYVGICYSTWFTPIADGAKLTSTSNKVNNQFYYWGEPALGFYRSDDKNVIRTHMTQLADAGVDFIIIDNTNASTSWKSSSYWNLMVSSSNKALLDTIYEMNSQGLKTPRVLNWINTNNGSDVVNAIYSEFYKNSKYKNIWVYYDGKPFILTTTSTSFSNLATRKMWGLQTSLAVNEWSYLQINNDKPARNTNGEIEQIGVSVAMQSTYMSNTATAVGRRKGETFYNQWRTAFKYHPKVVTITWWNEWAAQYINGNFTDEYNQEYSRDIEPMKGGHGSKYYEMMKRYISAYKANSTCPHLNE